VGKDFNIMRVLNKPLPFRGKINGWQSDDYQMIRKAIKGAPAKSVVIDDAGYLITNFFMRNHSVKGKGNDVFGLHNQKSQYTRYRPSIFPTVSPLLLRLDLMTFFNSLVFKNNPCHSLPQRGIPRSPRRPSRLLSICHSSPCSR